MADLLVRLYDLPVFEAEARVRAAGITVRRALPPEREIVLEWIRVRFSTFWVSEAALCLSQHPTTILLAIRSNDLLGFACYDGTAKAEYCAAYAGVPVAGSGFSCNPDFSAGMIGVVTRWTPVKNLTFSAETLWFHLHQNFTGSAVFSPAAGQPIQAWTYHDQDSLSLNVRVQRNF